MLVSSVFGIDRQKQYDNLMINLKEEKNQLVVISKVHKFFNNFKYAKDIDQFGKSDYWMTPKEFLASGEGDCEDFAIAKYYALKELGVKHLKFVVGVVKLGGVESLHLVLTHQREDKIYILDYNREFVVNHLLNFKATNSFDEKYLYKNKEGEIGNLTDKKYNNLKKFKELLNRL